MQIADETQAITQAGYYVLKNAKIKLIKRDDQEFSAVELFSPIELEKIYADIDKSELRTHKDKYAKIEVVEKDSFEAAKNLDCPLVMNFASATHKGGGFLRGSHAQEESLCRCSTLYASLTAQKAHQYYEHNRSLHSPLYSDYMLLSPNVCVFRNAHLALLAKSYNVSVATIPAPNLRNLKLSKAELRGIMLRRIRYFLSMAAARGYKNLVLGAWGCGAFRHNPYDVAGYFYEILIGEGFASLFDNIVFAIVKSKDNLNAFKDVFDGRIYNDLNMVRKKENQEIRMLLDRIEDIVKIKCSRCDNTLGCLGCNLNELQQDIEHAKKMMGFLV